MALDAINVVKVFSDREQTGMRLSLEMREGLDIYIGPMPVKTAFRNLTTIDLIESVARL